MPWALVLLALAAAQSDEEQIMGEARDAVELFCPVDFEPLNYAQARANLESSAGKDNFIYSTIVEANIGENGLSTESLTETIEENLQPSFVVTRAFAFVLFVILLVLWLSCCWCFLIPCCMRCCCRCCEVHHQLGKRPAFHVFLWVLFVILAATCVISQSLSFPAYHGIDQGLRGTACHSAHLVQDAVSGNNASSFIGIIPAIQLLEQMLGILQPDSQVMVELESLIDLTEIVEKAVTLILALFDNFLFLIDADNQKPGSYMHTCQVCIPVAEQLGGLLEMLRSGVAFALNAVRSEAKNQLQGDQVAQLRSSVDEITAPLQELKARIIDQIGFFISSAETGFQEIIEVVNGDSSYLFPTILGLFLLCLLLVVHGVFSLVVFACCGGRDHDPCCVRYSAGYSLCSSYCYSMLLLLLGGVMVIASTAVSGVCLVMLDFDKDLGEKLLPSLGVPLDPTVDLALDIGDRCMSLSANLSESMNLVDIITIPARDPSYPGERRTVRQDLVDLVIVPIEDAFAQLTTALDTQPPQLSSQPLVRQVLDMLGDVNMKSLIWTDADLVVASSRYRLMNPAFHAVSLNCPETTLGVDLPAPFDNLYVPGLDSMANGFSGDAPVEGLRADMATSTWDCPVSLTGDCGTSFNSNLASEEACKSGKAFLLEQKLPLATEPVFLCKYLQLPGAPWGTKCPVELLAKDANGTWQPECFFANGSLETFTRPCNLNEYAAYVQEFEQSIGAALAYIDDAVLLVLELLQVRLRELLDRHVLNPIQRLLDGFDCSFMRNFWSGVTSSLCLRSISGFHTMSVCYLIAGLVSLLMAAVMYVPWRISRDNEDIFEEQVAAAAEADAEAQAVVEAAVAQAPAVPQEEVTVPGTPEPNGVPNGSLSL